MGTKPRVLVAGRAGQVARSLAERAGAYDLDLVASGRPDLDLCDTVSVADAVGRVRPDVVINAAAYTAVDQAESDPEAAHALNADGAGHLARQAAALGVPILHLSTDYVFDGTKPEPYVETDPVAPLGVYGASKLAGEAAVAAGNPHHFIFRTAWVYSPFGKNFVKTMLRLAETRDELGVVADQMGNPTSALDIADGLLVIAKAVLDEHAGAKSGVYHLTGGGQAVWADLAEHVFAASAEQGGPSAMVRRIGSEAFPTPVTRPANSRLDCAKLADAFGVKLPDWRESATQTVTRLLNTRDSEI